MLFTIERLSSNNQRQHLPKRPSNPPLRKKLPDSWKRRVPGKSSPLYFIDAAIKSPLEARLKLLINRTSANRLSKQRFRGGLCSAESRISPLRKTSLPGGESSSAAAMRCSLTNLGVPETGERFKVASVRGIMRDRMSLSASSRMTAAMSSLVTLKCSPVPPLIAREQKQREPESRLTDILKFAQVIFNYSLIWRWVEGKKTGRRQRLMQDLCYHICNGWTAFAG